MIVMDGRGPKLVNIRQPESDEEKFYGKAPLAVGREVVRLV